MEFLDKNKLSIFTDAQKDSGAARDRARTKEYLSPAEIRENARKLREEQEKKTKGKSSWLGMSVSDDYA